MDERGGSSQWSVSWIMPVSYSYALYKRSQNNSKPNTSTLIFSYSVKQFTYFSKSKST